VRRVGDRATLLEFAGNAAVHAAAHAAREQFGQQLEDVVPGHTTLLLVWKDGRIVSALEALDHVSKAETTETGPTVTIPVKYDGADLDAVAAKLGVSPEAVVELHSEAEYTVAFMGFSPGFPYLIAAEPSPLLELPRLATPRTEVPSGSVAAAAGYCGIYPRSSPGGWNLLGRTEVVLFDAGRAQPALLEPGMRVRFESR
jgi:KipI family sensor histidine kinase inhibitor